MRYSVRRYIRVLAWLILAGQGIGVVRAKEAVDYVDPFIGTGKQGKTFPGAATPFGMVQLSPDTITGGDNGSGYRHYHHTIQGFSFTHMSGVGWYGDLGNFLVMPTVGPLQTWYGETDKLGTGYLSAFSNESETAQAGYYAVTLTDHNIRAEMTAAPHSGILRFTFPETPQSRIQFDLVRRVGGTAVEESVKVVDDHVIEGWIKCTPAGGGWGDGAGKADYTVYFHAEISVPLTHEGVWSAEIPDAWKRRREDVAKPEYVQAIKSAKVLSGCREMTGKHVGFYAEFPTRAGESIEIKTGISFVSIEGARQALKAEIPDWDFERVRGKARQAWSDELTRMTVQGGTETQKTAFYTAMYHVLLDPRILADVDGSYPGGDGAVHKTDRFTKRTIFSGWDVFRSDFPLLTLIAPGVVNDMVNSMVELADENGSHHFDRWEFLNAYSGCMVGNPMVPVIADAFVKGIRGFDADKAYEYARNSCERFGNGERGYALEGISNTLEYGYDEWCLAQLAEQTGHVQDAVKYAERGQSYRHLFDPTVGWFRARDAGGEFKPLDMLKISDSGCVESNPGQQGWFVPHDVPGLMELLGGQEKFTARLNTFFEKTPNFSRWNDYYNHSNEVVHLVPFMFNRAGDPWMAQKWIRAICDKAYGATPDDGIAGDEDVGQMSAWFNLAASGLHQACPGDPRYEIFSPLFDQVIIRLDPKYARGGTFTITTRNNSPENVYIQSATLNGKPLERCWISYQEIAAGGTLDLVLGPQPEKKWGVN